MKTTSYCLLIAILILSGGNFSFATKWRVNNNPVTSPHFTQVSSAINSASVLNGDTIYLEGSASPYASVNITKKVVLIGTGYFLGENDSTQATIYTSTLNGISFSNGSKGSQMIGISIAGYTNIYDTNMVIRKNFFNNTVSISGTANVVFIQNVISSVASMSVSGSNNIVVANNLFLQAYPWTYDLAVSSSTTLVANNIFLGNHNLLNCTVRNNIALGNPADGTANVTLTNSYCDHNIGASTQYGTSNGNQQNVNMNAVFLNTGSTDGKYRLASGSPAIGAGAGGTDCGIFGGNYPYVLSGMPEVPAIWYLNVNGNTVTIKAKGH
jgi:hypothetical protein